MNNVATNIHVLAFVWTYIFVSLAYIPRSGIARLYDNCLTCEKFSDCFPKGLHQFTFPAATCESSSLSTSLPTLVSNLFFYDPSSGCEVTSHGFNLHFPDGSLCMYLSTICKGVLKSLHQELISGKLVIMLEHSYFIIMEEKVVIW